MTEEEFEPYPEDEYVIIKKEPGMTITLSWPPDPRDSIRRKCEDYPDCEECRDHALDEECGDYPAPCNCDDPITHGGH